MDGGKNGKRSKCLSTSYIYIYKSMLLVDTLLCLLTVRQLCLIGFSIQSFTPAAVIFRFIVSRKILVLIFHRLRSMVCCIFLWVRTPLSSVIVELMLYVQSTYSLMTFYQGFEIFLLAKSAFFFLNFTFPCLRGLLQAYQFRPLIISCGLIQGDVFISLCFD